MLISKTKFSFFAWSTYERSVLFFSALRWYTCITLRFSSSCIGEHHVSLSPLLPTPLWAPDRTRGRAESKVPRTVRATCVCVQKVRRRRLDGKRRKEKSESGKK